MKLDEAKKGASLLAVANTKAFVVMATQKKQVQQNSMAQPPDDMQQLRDQVNHFRTALQLQSSRSKQLVSAYNSKLLEKDATIRKSQKLYDEHLASLGRTLIALEGSMRREQKAIVEQLKEKDRIIEEQRNIIEKLMSGQPMSTSSLSSRSPSITISSFNSPCLSYSSNESSRLSPTLLAPMHHTGITGEYTDSTSCASSPLNSRDSVSRAETSAEERSVYLQANSEAMEEDSKDTEPQVQTTNVQLDNEKLMTEELSKRSYLKNTSCKAVTVKPPKPPKPKICTPYRPQLKLSLISTQRQLKLVKKNVTIAQSLPELSVGTVNARTQDICLLLGPSPTSTLPTTTQHMHPTLATDDSNTSSTHVPRLMQRFDCSKTPRSRSHSCTSLSTLQLAPSPMDFEENEAENNENEQNAINRPQTEEKLLGKQQLEKNTHKNVEENDVAANKSEVVIENRSLGFIITSDTSSHPSAPTICGNNDNINSLNSCSTKDAEDINSLRGNFVEFHLDLDNAEMISSSGDDDALRTDGDGSETRQPEVISSQVGQTKHLFSGNNNSYEVFLETTGMSEKSILTPSRVSINNNHKSVLKPRDVKFRSRANRCFNNGTVKYWSGPYL